MFTHLHVHTEYSLLDGLPKIWPLVERAKELGMNAIAMTDHGVMYGAQQFYQACLENEVKPIIGVEAYLAPRSRNDKVPKIDDQMFHTVLIAENQEGYQNLVKLISLAHTEGFYYKPRIDRELLGKYHKGLIALSGCLQGEISRILLREDYEKAKKIAGEMSDLFGKDHYYLEMQRSGETEQEEVNPQMIKLSKETGIPLVATGDIHYIKQDDAIAQEVLMCINTGKTLDDPKRLKMTSKEYYLKSPEQMKELFSDVPNAIENTQKITEMANVEVKMKDWVLPKVGIPRRYKGNSDKYLRDLTFKRAKGKLSDKVDDAEKERLDYELKIIADKGFSDYMLMVTDFTDKIHNENIPMTTRGSAAGSLVAYCLGIVDANPMKFKLAFERFLNPLRPKAPDIDLDIASERREDIIEYAIKKYGKDHVAHIVTFGRMQARAAIRDAGRVLDMPLGYVDKIAKMVPPSGQGLAKVDIEKALNDVPELKKLQEEDPDVARLLSIAQKIEGVARHTSLHACGVLITPEPIIEHVPVIWDTTIERMVTQYEMEPLENLGYIKMDFLGLNNLDRINETLRLVKEYKGEEINLKELPLDDEKTYQLINDLDTLGTFQFETDVMKNTLKIIQPRDIFDVSASLALVRPGPNQYQQLYADRKEGKEKVTYIDPRMKEFLDLSYGVLVYQEDIIKTVIHLAGMDWAEADRVRKATGKKKPEVLFKMKDEIIDRFIKNGLTKDKAEQIFELFIPFTNYAFNQAHAAAYAITTYQTCYLKAHYPVEFMAALLKSEMGDTEKVSRIIEECERKGIKILPPDINKSDLDFKIEGEKGIRFGLAAIKNVGKGPVRIILEARGDKGEFKNLDHLLDSIDLSKINRKTLEYLVKAGALDSFGERGALISILPKLLERYVKKQKTAGGGQAGLFDLFKKDDEVPETPLPKTEALSDLQKLTWERELLGMYITSHPIKQIEPYLRGKNVVPIGRVSDLPIGKPTKVAGVITSVKTIQTKKDQRTMAFIQIEDITKEIELVLFPDHYEKFSEIASKDTMIVAHGVTNERNDELSIIARKLEAIDPDKIKDEISTEKPKQGQREVAFNVAENQTVTLRLPRKLPKDKLSVLKKTLAINPGNTKITLIIPNGGKKAKILTLAGGIDLNPTVKQIISPYIEE